jgi:hypothetical protein
VNKLLNVFFLGLGSIQGENPVEVDRLAKYFGPKAMQN